MNVEESSSFIQVDGEIVHVVTITEPSEHLVYVSEQAPNEIIIREQTPNVVSVTTLPHSVEVKDEKYFISITEGVLPAPEIQKLTDIPDVTGTPVLGSMIEYDGTNWVATMADFEVYSDEDSQNSNILYVGKAAPGSDSTNAVWQIQRITTSGSLIHIEWADGNNSFDNVWDSRENLNYS